MQGTLYRGEVWLLIKGSKQHRRYARIGKAVNPTYEDKATAKKPTTRVTTVTSFMTTSLGEGAGAYPSKGGNANDAVAGEGGVPISSGDEGEEGGSTTGSGEKEDGDGVGDGVTSGVGARDLDAAADKMTSASAKIVTMKEAIVY
nr:hypothetical protein [Tanacetum cinerariifolium]